jgi:hypothetical protein
MKKAIQALQQEFESSCSRTPEYLAWHRLFKREFTALLQSLGCQEIAIGKPNHFDMSGFFRTKDGQAWWFRIEDLRWSKDNMLVRTAQDFRDYTGGRNQYARLSTAETFSAELQRILGI